MLQCSGAGNPRFLFCRWGVIVRETLIILLHGDAVRLIGPSTEINHFAALGAEGAKLVVWRKQGRLTAMRTRNSGCHSLDRAEGEVEADIAFNLARTLLKISFHEAQIERVFVGAGFWRNHRVVDANPQHLRVDTRQRALIAAA